MPTRSIETGQGWAGIQRREQVVVMFFFRKWLRNGGPVPAPEGAGTCHSSSLPVAHLLQGAAVAALAGLLSSVAPGSAAADGPFAGLTGAWRGAAQVRLSSGNSETLKCNAYYTPKGAGELGLAIRCASAGNKIELRAQLTHSGGRVSGRWEERTYNASGDVTGQAIDGKLNLAIDGGAFKGSMAVRTTGASQTVSIRTTGIALEGVSISLSRS
ncbi:MAG: hypothetical protein SFW09_20505 [Hyphomicrobiaceae bacterium]|nr:hypothetical protein [Hyphomicrobiaceae bacterium]